MAFLKIALPHVASPATPAFRLKTDSAACSGQARPAMWALGTVGVHDRVRGHLEEPSDKPVLRRLQGGGTVPAPSALETGRGEERAVTQPRCPWKRGRRGGAANGL